MKQVLIVGLPSSGKSTYLSALTWCLEKGSGHATLRLTKRTGDTTYIDELMSRWAQARELEKTRAGTQHSVRWQIQDTETEVEFEVVAPDVSGETYSEIWADRRWTTEFDENVRSSGSLLLFLSVRERYRPVSLAQTSHVARAIASPETDGATPTSSETPEEDGARPTVEWKPIDANPLVKVVDILQMIHGVRPSLPVGIVLSAWDRIENPLQTPSVWLASECPLLDQYLEGNGISTAVFGVSAQGCDYQDVPRVEEIRESPPAGRPRVWTADGSKDNTEIGDPIAWALAADRS